MPSGDGWEGWLIDHGRGPLPVPGGEQTSEADDAPEQDETDTSDH